MTVGVRIECDHPGCGRHIDVDVEAELGRPLVVTRPPTTVWLEGGIRLGHGWAGSFGGKPARWRLFCRDHAPAEPRRG